MTTDRTVTLDTDRWAMIQEVLVHMDCHWTAEAIQTQLDAQDHAEFVATGEEWAEDLP